MRGRLTTGPFRTLSLAALAACALFTGACASRPQTTFTTPEDAVQELIATARSGEVSRMERIFGPESKAVIASGDRVQDRNQRQVFVVAADEQWHLEDLTDGGKELVIGNERWPFPIPLVNEDGAWRFDTAAGLDEVVARRIGRNELAVIKICLNYVAAQNEYAATGHDGKPAGLYTQRFFSTPGTQDGLYWRTGPDEDPSPLGALVAEAADEGYTRSRSGKRTPFHGYYFHTLTSQTAAAPNGAKDYLLSGNMSGGFAMVAYPSSYGQTGVMTFIVNQDGVVLQSDLGEDTARIASKLTTFNPTDTWKIVE